MPKIHKKLRQGFTLVELSIVIIIIGFLISGISAGASLIKSAKLNSVITEMTSHEQAYFAFITRYGQMPGDFSNANAFWASGCTVTAANCSGNGDGFIKWQMGDLGAGTGDETKRVWKHLFLAGLTTFNPEDIPDTAYGGALNSGYARLNISHPGTKANDSGMYSIITGPSVIDNPNANGIGDTFWDDGTTAIYLGSGNAWAGAGYPNPVGTGGWGAAGGAFAAADASSLDSKIDDGNPDSGSFRAALGSQTSDYTGQTCASGGAYSVAATNTYATCLVAKVITR
jgi:prepilin-type N-terminal cleavage/methylation domain-containing protein